MAPSAAVLRPLSALCLLPRLWNRLPSSTSLSVPLATARQPPRRHIAAAAVSTPVLGYGEKDSLTYLKTGSACLDLFFDAVPDVEEGKLRSLLAKAWEEDAETALRAAFQLGDPRGGKGDLWNYRRALLWLYEEKYETLMLNLRSVPQFAYYGALLDLLQYACHPSLLEERLAAKAAHKERKRYIRSEGRLHRRIARRETSERLVSEFLVERKVLRPEARVKVETSAPWHKPERWRTESLKADFEDWVRKRNAVEGEAAAVLRRKARALRAERAEARYREDHRYARLFDEVAAIFAEGLRDEEAQLRSGKSLGGLVAKWAPTPQGEHDKRTEIAAGIAKRLFPEATQAEPSETYAVRVSRARDDYRRLLSRLRGAAEVPEHFVGTGRWADVNYKRMASRCRQVWGHLFRQKDEERYDAYLQAAAEGKVKQLAAGAVLPVELVDKALQNEGEAGAKEAGLQWLTLVKETKAAGALPPALAVCDVSGSMSGRPMDVSVALGLLISDVSDGPWQNRVCTFSESPSFVTVPPADAENLAERARHVLGMDWGWNTDFLKVFDELLKLAQFCNLEDEKMAKVLFIFSDMEFDDACKGPWKTDYEVIKEKYAAAGYSLPKIVFWNLRSSPSKPVGHSQPGVAMLSGYSAGLLKSFLAGDLEKFEPLAQMLQALKVYECLEVAACDL